MVVDINSKEKIYVEYHEKVYHYLYGKTLNKELSEDLAADVFVKVYSKLDSFDDTKASISTWIYRITQNTLIDYYRVRKVHSEVSEEIAATGDIDDELLNNEMLEALADALMKLDERERKLIILRYFRGMTLKEVAQSLGMSYSNTKLIHNKCIVELKKYLGAFNEE